MTWRAGSKSKEPVVKPGRTSCLLTPHLKLLGLCPSVLPLNHLCLQDFTDRMSDSHRCLYSYLMSISNCFRNFLFKTLAKWLFEN